MSTSIGTSFTSLPLKYSCTYDEILEQTTIDVDSNYLYCLGQYNIARINLNNATIDSASTFNIGDSVYMISGLFFDKQKREILCVGRGAFLTNRFYLISYNFNTNIKHVVCRLKKPYEDLDGNYYAYDDKNDIYSIINEEISGVKIYNYNSNTGAFIDSCTLSLDMFGIVFYNNCQELSQINENNVPQNFSIYPNPSSSVIEINGGETNSDISIVSVNGIIIKHLRNTNNQVDINDLPNGMYFLKRDCSINCVKLNH